jgi:hypothetical protein
MNAAEFYKIVGLNGDGTFHNLKQLNEKNVNAVIDQLGLNDAMMENLLASVNAEIPENVLTCKGVRLQKFAGVAFGRDGNPRVATPFGQKINDLTFKGDC